MGAEKGRERRTMPRNRSTVQLGRHAVRAAKKSPAYAGLRKSGAGRGKGRGVAGSRSLKKPSLSSPPFFLLRNFGG